MGIKQIPLNFWAEPSFLSIHYIQLHPHAPEKFPGCEAEKTGQRIVFISNPLGCGLFKKQFLI